MSLGVFWVTVRRAVERAKSTEAGDRNEPIDWLRGAQAVERTLSDHHDLWLSPSVVSDFDVRDFDFLSEEELSRLERLVEDFAKVAKDPGERSGPVTPDERDEAKPLLMEIAKILDFERYQDPDALRLGKLIERELQSRGSGEIERLEFKTDYDHTGDPGIWIWAYLNDAAVETDEAFRCNTRRIGSIIDSVARKIAPDRWPYIAFRSIGELAYLAEVRRAQ